MNVKDLRGKLLLSILFGVVVYGGVTFFVDFNDVGSSLADFNWALIPLILVLTTMNYVFRFVKWEYYLRLIGVQGLSRRDSFLIFFSGLGMVITPGKVGEWLKSYLLREVHGTPIARSAPILIAERVTDSIALLIICAAGVFVFGDFWQAFVVVAIGVVVLIAVSRHRPTAMRILHLGDRIPLVKRFVPQLEEFYESTYVLLSPRAVIMMGALSAFSWFFEVLGFYFTFVGLGLDGNGELLLQAAFILPIATLASAILMTPGGLGVAEGALVTLSVALLDISRSSAAVATFIIRFGTLWFGVIVGLIAFGVLSRRLSLNEEPETAQPAIDPQASSTDAGLLGRTLFLLGGIGMTASPFLPWISVTFIFSVDASLYEAAKLLDDYSGFAEVLTIGIFTLAGSLLRFTRLINVGWARVWGIAGGGAGLVEVVYRYVKFQDSFGSEFGLASLQFGFYLLGIASIIAAVGVLADRK